VTLSVRTDAQETRDVNVALGKNPDKDAPYLGIEYALVNRQFSENSPFLRNGRGAFAGVLVASVVADGPAAKAGLKEQDRITAIDSVPVQSPQAVADAVSAHRPGDSLALTIYRPSEEREIQVKVTLGENPNDKTKGYLGISMSSFMAPGMGFRFPVEPDAVTTPTPQANKVAPGM